MIKTQLVSLDEIEKLATKLLKAVQSTREKQERLERPKRLMKVRWGGVGESLEVYYLQARDGKFRLCKNVPGNGQYVPDSHMIETWFKQLQVTHVVPFDDYHQDLPDNKPVPVRKYIKWLRDNNEEEDD